MHNCILLEQAIIVIVLIITITFWCKQVQFIVKQIRIPTRKIQIERIKQTVKRKGITIATPTITYFSPKKVGVSYTNPHRVIVILLHLKGKHKINKNKTKLIIQRLPMIHIQIDLYKERENSIPKSKQSSSS